ncbi:MAG: N-acetylmuramoyl-L-alanine amidase [Oscillospiraceae bacterium]|nr:N-acetylmuramoyl-L-alanine amidase [Oscillospiraceae bacterium]
MSEKLRITIDPGHGERDNPYPAAKGFFEGTQMWRLAGFLKAELEKRGFDVATTRPKITDNPSVDSRGKSAADNGSVFMLSLHSNATADTTQTSVTGSEVFLSVKGREHKPLAEKLLTAVCRVMTHQTRGVKERTLENSPNNDWFGVIRSAANNGCTCAMLMEHGFHTNPKDAQFLTVDSNLRRLAEAEAEVIAEHFGISAEEPLTAADAVTALRAAAGLEVLSPKELKRLDLNKDGVITSADALMILRVVAGLNPEG